MPRRQMWFFKSATFTLSCQCVSPNNITDESALGAYICTANFRLKSLTHILHLALAIRNRGDTNEVRLRGLRDKGLPDK
ncbi:MAG: hypothetical protein V7K50_01145 [Nostoc sp.]|uniref:hypothetical protein n=1 Tax=Nostoc sp. TaxID=1180 RepID=UPI002FF5160A